MKLIGLAGILALSSLACQRKEEANGGRSPAPTSAESGSSLTPAAEEKREELSATKPTKASERPTDPVKKLPVAEPVADKPGFVKSPFSGSIIDVRGIPAGAMVADPMYPAAEKKHFRVPQLSPEDEARAREEEARRELAEETAKLNAPTAEAIPGNPRFIASPHVDPGPNPGPYDRVIIDTTGLEPGSVVRDPTSTPDDPRFMKVPGDPSPTDEE